MNYKHLFVALGILSVVGCSMTGGRKKEGGYDYEVVRKGTGEVIPVGSYVDYNMEIAYKDSIMQTISQQLQVEENPTIYNEFNSLVRLFSKMHDGDSFHFYFPLDSFKMRPPGFENFTEPIVYRIGISKVMSETAFKAYADSMQVVEEAKRQVVQARSAEIEALAKTTFADFKKGALDSKLQKTDSGLRYQVLEQGTGETPKVGDMLSVHYYGVLASDGTRFDDSFSKGAPYTLPVGRGQVIQGWDEGLLLFPKGTKAFLFIPYALAYGEEGRPGIPPSTDLIFYVEVE